MLATTTISYVTLGEPLNFISPIWAYKMGLTIMPIVFAARIDNMGKMLTKHRVAASTNE